MKLSSRAQKVQRRQICIVKLSSIGDVVLALPFALELRRRYPDSSIHWIVEEKAEPILQAHPVVDKIITVPKEKLEHAFRRLSFRKLFSLVRKTLRKLRAHQYDLAFDLQGLWRSALIMACLRAEEKVGFANAREAPAWFYTRRIQSSPRQHALFRNLSQLEPATHFKPDFGLRIKKECRKTDQFLCELGSPPRLVLIHPGASQPHKRWPWKRFARLADALSFYYSACVVVLGGRSEKRIVRRILRSSLTPLINGYQRFSLDELAELAKRADLFVGNDTGCTHIAAAVGCPTVALFGPTDPKLTGPVGDKVKVLREPFPCSPCFNRPVCQNSDCLQQITVAEVFKASSELLQADARILA